jgi:hypothetical protein
MEKLIDLSTSFYGTGIVPQGKIFKIPSGQYKDRVIAIYPKDSNTLVFSWSDPPYLSWSSPTDIVTNSADCAASGFMDTGGNVHLVYTMQSTLALAWVKLSFSLGVWTAGTFHTICGVGSNYYPSIIKDSQDRLRVCWSYYDSSTYRYYVHTKASADDGVTWGSGETDPGTALTTGSSSCYSRLLFAFPYINCFYSDGGTKLAYRRMEISASSWETEMVLHSGSNINDDFRSALSSDNRIGIVFPGSSSLLYKEYDGNSWSGLFTVAEVSPISPTLRFSGKIPYVFYGKNIGNKQNQLFYSYLENNSFVASLPLVEGAKTFDKVFCYDDSATAQYYDRTTEASNTNSGDVFHPTSLGLLKDSEDCLYLGKDFKFNLVRMVLSVTGVGGEISWSYWDGEAWVEFVPYSGAYHLDDLEKTILLWQDLNSSPSFWQQCLVNDQNKFWIKLKVKSAFTATPVGTQITDIPECKYLCEVS